MKIKRILLDPDPRLRVPCADVTEPWEELEPNVRLMFKAMYRAHHGVGLAAPQVGWSVRLFVMNPDQRTFKPQAQRVYWNPEIVQYIGEPALKNEGCLSLPHVYGDILRFPGVKLRAVTPRGPVEEVLDGAAAWIVQHEVDHLNGKLCYEHWTATPARGKA